MSEKDMRHTFIKLAHPIDPKPIENMLEAGTPDIWAIPGGIELKWAREWPVRVTSPLRLDHYTNVQREWLINRWNKGGGAWLLLQVRTCWLCFEAPVAQKVGYLTKDELFSVASNSSFVKPTTEQICSWFRRASVA